ncbi:MAG: hypothetical protein ABMA25_01335 [Ilumatobacteraceae bacterium]
MKRFNLAVYGGAMSAVACWFGVRLWLHEDDHPSGEVADQLKWLGGAVALLGAAGVLFAIAVTRRPDDDEE